MGGGVYLQYVDRKTAAQWAGGWSEMRKDRLGGLINGLLAACRYFDGVMHVLYDLHGALIHFFVFLTLNVCSSSIRF